MGVHSVSRHGDSDVSQSERGREGADIDLLAGLCLSLRELNREGRGEKEGLLSGHCPLALRPCREIWLNGKRGKQTVAHGV
jgi:hypothetical protein